MIRRRHVVAAAAKAFVKDGLQLVHRHRPSNWRRLSRDLRNYQRSGREETVELLPCISDWTSETPIDPVYFYQDAWAFERIFAASPSRHVDVGSHHKLVALLSRVIETTMIDIRPLGLNLEGLHFQAGSIVDLPFEDEACESVSSICVIEHIGLGRYGDPIDAEGSQTAAAELSRVTAPDGRLYISVPVGPRSIAKFNSHRVFTEAQVLELFPRFEVCQSRYIYGKQFTPHQQPTVGTGCYELHKVR